MFPVPLSSLDTSPVQAALVLGRMHPARKVTVDVGGNKDVEIPQDISEPLTNMSATVQQVWLALRSVNHVGCSSGMRACPQALAVRVCCCHPSCALDMR